MSVKVNITLTHLRSSTYVPIVHIFYIAIPTVIIEWRMDDAQNVIGMVI